MLRILLPPHEMASFEVPEVEHENVRDCARKDCGHNVRYESCTLRESVHAIDRLSTFSGHSFLLLGTRLTVPSVNGMYAIVTSVSKRMFPFCSDASRPSATDEAEWSYVVHSQPL